MRQFVWVLALAVVPGLAAQEPERPPVDSARAERLRAEVERRFGERVRLELGLSEDQAQKLKATQEKYGERRRALMRDQMEARQALGLQMRPGVQANSDSVQRLMDRMQQGRQDMLKLEQDQDRDMAGYLTPVQRAQFQMMRQRFLDRLQDMRGGRGWLGPRRGMMRPQGQERPRRRP